MLFEFSVHVYCFACTADDGSWIYVGETSRRFTVALFFPRYTILKWFPGLKFKYTICIIVQINWLSLLVGGLPELLVALTYCGLVLQHYYQSNEKKKQFLEFLFIAKRPNLGFIHPVKTLRWARKPNTNTVWIILYDNNTGSYNSKLRTKSLLYSRY